MGCVYACVINDESVHTFDNLQYVVYLVDWCRGTEMEPRERALQRYYEVVDRGGVPRQPFDATRESTIELIRQASEMITTLRRDEFIDTVIQYIGLQRAMNNHPTTSVTSGEEKS